MATSIIKPVHAGIDFSFTIAVADWSSSSPYTYTWTNSAVTDGCRVEVDFSSASTNTDTMYLSYEKVSGGIQFTAPEKPTTAIIVVVHVINAQTGNTLAVTDEMVSSDAISGAANVNEALISLNSNITNLIKQETGTASTNANGILATGVSLSKHILNAYAMGCVSAMWTGSGGQTDARIICFNANIEPLANRSLSWVVEYAD